MWIANLHNDKGSSLASFIINSKYSCLPKAILLPKAGIMSEFGKVCPKLKAIIIKYNIWTRVGTDLRKELNKLRL
jgi:hypothetical protein